MSKVPLETASGLTQRLIIEQHTIIDMRQFALSLTLFYWLGLPACSRAQDHIDKYCLLINETSSKALGDQNTFKLFLGYEQSLVAFKDTSLLAQLRQVEKRTTLVDAFNYLASLGWQYVGLTASMNSRNTFGNTNPGPQYLFKRTFERSALK